MQIYYISVYVLSFLFTYLNITHAYTNIIDGYIALQIFEF
jgi:hypothetical protein